jgi:2,4-dichlorophenol 6-monooxygenase
LPHAWLEHNGERISTHDLTEVCACFALITGPRGGQWAQAAQAAEEKYRVRITVAAIGDDADYTDSTGSWGQLREIEEGGAILVRPDNHVGWRSISETTNPADDLAGAISSILAR